MYTRYPDVFHFRGFLPTGAKQFAERVVLCDRLGRDGMGLPEDLYECFRGLLRDGNHHGDV